MTALTIPSSVARSAPAKPDRARQAWAKRSRCRCSLAGSLHISALQTGGRSSSRIQAATLERAVSDASEKAKDIASSAASVVTGPNREESVLMQGVAL